MLVQGPDGAEFVIEMKRHQFDGDVGNGDGIGREAPAEQVEIGQSVGIEFDLDGLGEFGLASAIMSQRQQPDHGAARPLLAVALQKRFEGAPISTAREELFAIDQIEQGHRLAAQGVDDVPVIDNVTVLAVGVRSATAQRHQRRRAEEAFQPVIIEPHAQAVADQARGHRIEHPLEDEAARRGDADDRLLVIRRPARRQCFQRRTLEIEALGAARVAPPDDLKPVLGTAVGRTWG